MISVFFSCFDCMRWNREKNKDDETFLKLIRSASMDPLRESKRLRIVSQIDRGIDLDILEMRDFSPNRRLGSGAFSEVCLLIRKKDQGKFAGKFLKCEIRASDFISEASIMKSCSSCCTSIVNLVGIITTPKCLVLDYYVNGSLDIAFLKDNTNMDNGNETEFPFLRRLGYILDMCRAVEVLHRKNICHRDIALRNLLLSNDKEHVLLSDFSLSRIMDSAIERQSTLTALVPETSAPETFYNSQTFTPGSDREERFYSLKSDIWSLGIVMFEIVDMELINVDTKQCLPSGFPSRRLPSKMIFNRIEELWMQVIRCWDKKPERRPQSWEVHEQMEMLIQNPLNIGNENEGYKTHFSDRNSPTLRYHHKDPNYQSCDLFPRVYTDCTHMNRVSVDMLELSDSSIPDSPMSSIPAELVSPDDIDHLIMEELIDRFAKGHKLIIQGKGDQSTSNKQKWIKLNLSGDENVSNEHLIFAPDTPSANANTFSPSIKLIKRSCINSSRRKMYDQSISNFQGIPGSRFINLGSQSSLGPRLSLGPRFSMYSQSLTSWEEASVISEGEQYCPPLSLSFRSSATNKKYCRDLHIFQKVPENSTPERRAEILLAQDSEGGEQTPSAYQPSTIEVATPKFFVIVS